LSASTTTPALGGEVDLTATIVNRGGAGSLQTHLVIALPATATLLGAPAYQAGSGCTGTQTVDCFLDYIPNGGTTHVWFNVRITGDASLTATASADRDSDPSDNAATIALTVPTAASVTHAPAAPAPTKGKVLVGNARANRLVGTPRNDMLNGRGGNDVLIGLGGNDTLIGGPGNDTIYARDGKRDVIDCGTGKDVVYADRYDKVAANCEVVHRS
jgi:Ca2+-binding RTX toxin-like protein